MKQNTDDILMDQCSEIIKHLELGIIRFTYPDFIIIDINNKALLHLKQMHANIIDVSDLKGKSLFEIKDDFQLVDWQSTFLNGSHFIDHEIFKMNGVDRFLKLIYQPLYDSNREIIEVIGIGIDITDEIRVQDKMKELLKMQEELFTTASHELKTPLSIIFNTNQLMETYLQNPSEINYEKLIKGIQIIKQNCYRFTKLINNVTDSTKIDLGNFDLHLQNVDIVELIRTTLGLIKEMNSEEDVKISFETDIDHRILALDTDKMERVLLNLISNAIKFSQPGDKIIVSLVDYESRIELSIADKGIGIDKRYQDSIFERYQQVDRSLTRRAEGSGIGLSLVKSIVELHGGTVSVESELNIGSTFKVVLPVKIVEEQMTIDQTRALKNYSEMIEIEFSDIYLNRNTKEGI